MAKFEYEFSQEDRELVVSEDSGYFGGTNYIRLTIYPTEAIDNISPFIPRKIKKEKFMISHFGLGFVTHANLLRDGSLGLNKKVCMYPISDSINTLEVRSEKTLTSVAPIIEQYWQK